MKVSRKGAKFVAGWEGFTARPTHFDFDPPGVITQGYGITNGERPEIRLGGPRISRRTARRWLREALDGRYLAAVRELDLDLQQREVDALASAAYNLGPALLTDPGFSTLARRLQSREARTYGGRRRIYREELPRWDKAGGQQLAGLTARRHAEVRLANHGDYSI